MAKNKYIPGQDFFRIGKVRISITDEDKAIASIKDYISKPPIPRIAML